MNAADVESEWASLREWWPVAALTAFAAAVGAVLVIRERQRPLLVANVAMAPEDDPGLQALDRVLHRGVKDSELEYLRTGMRPESMRRTLKAFGDAKLLGISPTELAVSGRYFGQEVLPLRIEIYPDGKTWLNDGRHLYTIAKDMGASHALADVVLYDNDGDVRFERRAVVRLL